MLRLDSILVALSALVALVAAQTQTFTIDPAEVTASTRASWCTAETNNCQLLCGSQSALVNTCDYATLSYNCTCHNGTSPGLQYYANTIPSYICEQAYSDCITANVGNANGQLDCTSNIEQKCGKLNAASAAAGSSSTSSSSTTSAPSSAASSAGTSVASAAATTSSSTGAGPSMAPVFGNGLAAVAAGLGLAAAALL